jgi:hypothetical protein
LCLDSSVRKPWFVKAIFSSWNYSTINTDHSSFCSAAVPG